MTTDEWQALMEQLTDLARVINNPSSVEARAAIVKMEAREKEDPDERSQLRSRTSP